MDAERFDVVHIVNQMRPGGIETMVLDLVEHSRHRSCIFSLEGSNEGLIESWPGLARVDGRLDGFERPPGLLPKLVLRVARRLKELSPKAVFLHRISPLLYGGLGARLSRVPTVVHVEHDVWHYSDKRRRALLKWSARMVRPQHFAVSQGVATTLGDLLPGAPIRVVPAGVDLARFSRGERGKARASLGIPDDAQLIGSAGRLEAVKGHADLITAMRHLPDTTSLVIAGRGSLQDELAALAGQIGVGERVRFLGHRDDLEQILPALDVFCLPSLSEGLPRVIMEVQAADLPVIATDVGSVRQAICPETGRLVPAGEPQALAAALQQILTSPPPRGAAREFAMSNFSLARMVGDYDAMVA